MVSKVRYCIYGTERRQGSWSPEATKARVGTGERTSPGLVTSVDRKSRYPPIGSVENPRSGRSAESMPLQNYAARLLRSSGHRCVSAGRVDRISEPWSSAGEPEPTTIPFEGMFRGGQPNVQLRNFRCRILHRQPASVTRRPRETKPSDRTPDRKTGCGRYSPTQLRLRASDGSREIPETQMLR